MRQITKALFASCILLACASCHNDDKQIRDAAQGYLDAMGNYRPADARPYASKETCDSTLDFFEQVMKTTDPSSYSNNMPAKITLGEIAVEDSLAEIEYHKSTPTNEQDGTLHLVKREGQWQVHEIIQVPPVVRAAVYGDTSHPGRKFTSEQVAQMRANRDSLGDKKELSKQE